MAFRRHGRIVVGLALSGTAAGLSGTLHAQSTGVQGIVALSSQLVDRGLAVTPATPILQGAVFWASPSGWSLGVSGSAETRSPGHLVETLAQASHSWVLSSDWQMQAGLLYYDYPGNSRSSAYDRAELGVSWIYRDILTFAVSGARVVHTDDHRTRGAADLDFHWPLMWHFSLSAGAGIAQTLMPSHGPYSYGVANHYTYGHAGLIWSDGPWRVEFEHIANNQDLRWSRHNSSAVATWVTTISRSF